MLSRKKARRSDYSEVTTAIRESFGELCDHPTFVAWMQEEPLAAGDLVVVNNSFIFRSKVTTVKNQKFVACEVGKGHESAPEPVIAEAIRLNSDLKRISSKSRKLPL